MNEIVLSVLIPVFNWNISDLLDKLIKEIISNKLDNVEIVILDDMSSDLNLKKINRKNVDFFIQKYPHLKLIYKELLSNIGRAAVRNLLIKESNGLYLLFLDCDILPDSNIFLQKYINFCRNRKYDVVCGGLSYKQIPVSKSEYKFYLFLSNMTDVKPAVIRNTAPWRYVLTSNVAVNRCVLEKEVFGDFKGYGYEDVEWAIRIHRQFKIIHIDNQVTHLGLVQRSKVYERMVTSIDNYFILSKLHPMEFEESRIFKYILLFQLINIPMLKLLKLLLEKLFFLNLGDNFSYVVFQLQKAVLFTIKLKKDN
ncbi:glycosyltransferase family 2 protein [Propionispora hippei]|uniref:Glycosyltransferase, GT2 family n=1 Tax=Propionispora hippei DSM 15287 TaxID=1123003 RepID=A0A1M6K242_9FIRM|nr:glycosyltransferase family A protein [Propionispora hippei]SHJ52988.1 Glycosyltransferase, GT2 family [Propionispora hippei DSM 15287]